MLAGDADGDRYAAAIPRAGIFWNLVSHNYLSYYHDYLGRRVGGLSASGERHHGQVVGAFGPESVTWRRSRTPVMLVHGLNDHNVPRTESEMLYIALQKCRRRNGARALPARGSRPARGQAPRGPHGPERRLVREALRGGAVGGSHRDDTARTELRPGLSASSGWNASLARYLEARPPRPRLFSSGFVPDRIPSSGPSSFGPTQHFVPPGFWNSPRGKRRDKPA